MLKVTRAVLSALVIPGALLYGQTTNNFHFNVAGGLSLATARFGDDNDAGYNLTAGIGVMQHNSPLGFRVEGMYNEFNQKGNDELPFDEQGASHAAALTV